MFQIVLIGVIIQNINDSRRRLLTLRLRLGHGRASQIIFPQGLNLEGLVRESGRIIDYNGHNCQISIRSHMNMLEIEGGLRDGISISFSLVVDSASEINLEMINCIGGLLLDRNIELLFEGSITGAPNLSNELNIVHQSRQGVKSLSRSTLDSARSSSSGGQGRFPMNSPGPMLAGCAPMLSGSGPLLAGNARQQVQWEFSGRTVFSPNANKALSKSTRPANATPAILWNLKIEILNFRAIEVGMDPNAFGLQLVEKVRDSGLNLTAIWSRGIKLLFNMKVIIENQNLRSQNLSNGSILFAVPKRELPNPVPVPIVPRQSPAYARIRNIEILLRNIKACVENSALDAEPAQRRRYNEPENAVLNQPSVVQLGHNLIEFGQLMRKWAIELSKLSDLLIRDPEITVADRDYLRRLVQNNMDTARYTSPTLMNIYSLSIPLLAPPPRNLTVTQPLDPTSR